MSNLETSSSMLPQGSPYSPVSPPQMPSVASACAAATEGDDHRKAADLLKTAVPDGAKLSSALARLLDVKDEAHCGVLVVAPRKARDTVRWAASLVARAADEVER